MLLEMAFLTHRDASLYISQCHIIIQHLIGGLLYFCGFRVPTAAINYKLLSLHVKKCSFHVTLPYKNRCKNYTNNDVDSQATPKWYIKHDIITVLLLEALERQRNASALPPLPHEKGFILWYTFLHEESFRLVGACWDLSGLVGSLSGLVGSCPDLSGVVGTCWDLLGLVGNVDFMESHFEGIAIVVNKISAKFPIPKILRSVPVCCMHVEYCWLAMLSVHMTNLHRTLRCLMGPCVSLRTENKS